MRGLRRRRRPGMVALPALIGVAWAVIVAVHATGHADWFGHQHLVAGLAGWSVLAAWGLMAVGMMGPSSLPIARYVSANTLRPRRAVAGFFAFYLLTWLGFLLAFTVFDTTLHVAAGEGSVLLSGVITAAAFLAAAAWQLTPHKREYVLSCKTVGLLPARGGTACRALGWRQGMACVGSCGPMMLATMAAPSGRLLWMPVVSTLAFYEKATRFRRRLARPSAAVLAAAAVVYLAIGLH